MTRTCQICLKSFAATDVHEQYCPECRRDVLDPRTSRRRGQWIYLPLFIALLLPVSLLVERWMGLWSSGYEALKAHAPAAFMEDGEFQTGHAVYILPAAIVSVALTAGVAWGVGTLFTRQVRRKR